MVNNIIKQMIISKPFLWACCFFMFFGNTSSYGQEASKSYIENDIDRKWIYKKSNVYIIAHPGFSPKPRITSFHNPYNHEISLKGVMNFNFGLAYMYNFNEKFGLSAEIALPLLSNKSLKIKYTLNGSMMEDEDRELYVPNNSFSSSMKMPINHMMNMNIKFLFRKQVTKNIDFVSSLGFGLQSQRSFLYIYNSSSIETDGTILNLFDLNFENKGNSSIEPVVSAFISFGVNQILKNNRYLNYQLSAHLPFSNPYTNGSFSILPDSPYESFGTFKLMPWTVNLEVNYVFTFAKKKTRKGFMPNQIL